MVCSCPTSKNNKAIPIELIGERRPCYDVKGI